MNERVKPFEDKMNKTLEVLKEEYASVRAGRANPHLLDKLRVDYYGTPSPIQSVANISNCMAGRPIHDALVRSQ